MSENISLDFNLRNKHRGKDKREAIRDILTESNHPAGLTDAIHKKFMESIDNAMEGFTEITGATELFKYIKKSKIKLAVGSGLPREVINKLIQKLNWNTLDFDYTGSSEELGKGRPDPIMLNDVIYKLNISDRQSVLKTGDTIVDILEGKNAGALTASVLTGTQSREELEKYNPDFIFNDINGILQLL